MYDFRIGQRYTFDTHAPSILGQSFKDAELTAIVNYETAALFEAVHLKHNQVLAYLPDGTNTDPTSTSYYVFKTTSGSRLVLGYTWIVESSIRYSEAMSISVLIADAQADDMLKIKQVLALAGYNKTSITSI